MAHGGSHSRERLRHDLGAVLEVFMLRRLGESSGAVTAVVAKRPSEQQQQRRPAVEANFGGRPAAVLPSATAVTVAAAASPYAAQGGEPRVTSHALSCRITQHGHISPASASIYPRHGHLATDGGATTHLVPSSAAARCHHGRPAQLASGAGPTALHEQITLPKRVSNDYGQAPPLNESSAQLAAKYSGTEVSGLIWENWSNRSELRSENGVLYEKVAQRLDEIATEINHKYFPNQENGRAQKELTLAVTDMVREVTSNSFNNTVSRIIPHGRPEVQQLALLYQLTSAAIFTVGSGTTCACQLADLCVQYAFDRFASFILAKGGLEFALDDSDFEVD